MTQAALAQAAGVSPRFLVQLEGGQGNISVQRLAEVCAALEIPLDALFRGLGPGRPDKIALVGLRGAGKSTVGPFGKVPWSTIGLEGSEIEGVKALHIEIAPRHHAVIEDGRAIDFDKCGRRS